jgi:DNA (cytosine-5)-methyltransferase 1
MQRRAAEFFAGIGLMRMGLDMEGWSTVWANDIDEKKWEMYRANFNEGGCEFQLGDVHETDGKDIPDIELATASFPCNDLSLAGSRGGLAGAHSSAFWGFMEALKGMGRRRPPLVLLENVPGFLRCFE